MAKTMISPATRMQRAITFVMTIVKTDLIIYLVAIAAAEVVTVFFMPLVGMIGHIAILAATIAHSSLTSEQPRQRILLALALVPLVRIISLSMALGNIPQIWWYPIIYAPLLVASFVVMRSAGFRPTDVGVNFGRIPVQLLVALTGLGFGVVEYFILVKLPAEPVAALLGLSTEALEVPIVAEFTWQAVWWPALIFLACTGFVEVLIFRGVLQRSVVAVWGWWGIIYASLIFAILHIGFLSWIDVIFVFAVAVFFAWIVKRTGSLLGVTLSHGITNIILYLIAPFFF